ASVKERPHVRSGGGGGQGLVARSQPDKGEYTPVTACPPFVGRSNLQFPNLFTTVRLNRQRDRSRCQRFRRVIISSGVSLRRSTSRISCKIGSSLLANRLVSMRFGLRTFAPGRSGVWTWCEG